MCEERLSTPFFIGVVAYKGGTGKTTLSTLLGVGLSLFKGKRVLLIDLDPQANLTEVFLTQSTYAEVYKQYFFENKVFSIEFFINPDKEPALYMVRNTFDKLYLLPSSHKYMRSIELFNVPASSVEKARARLGELAERHGFDYIIIDLPPQMYHLVNTIASISTDFFVTAVSKGAFSDIAVRYMLEAFYEWARTVRKERVLNILLGIVLTRFLTNETHNIKIFGDRLREIVLRYYEGLRSRAEFTFQPISLDPVFRTVLYYNTILTKLRGTIIGKTPYIVKVVSGYYRGKSGEEIRKRLISNISDLVNEFEERVNTYASIIA